MLDTVVARIHLSNYLNVFLPGNVKVDGRRLAAYYQSWKLEVNKV